MSYVWRKNIDLGVLYLAPDPDSLYIGYIVVNLRKRYKVYVEVDKYRDELVGTTQTLDEAKELLVKHVTIEALK